MSVDDAHNREYPEQFECSICNDLFVCPVTLLCQHTFCRDCISTYHQKQSQPEVDDDGFQVWTNKKDRNPKCPLCRCAIVIPPNDNNVLKDFIRSNYQEKYESRVEQQQKDQIKNDMKKEIKDELRKEMFNALLDETIETRSDGLINIQDQENDIVHEGITRYTSPYVTIYPETPTRSPVRSSLVFRPRSFSLWSTSHYVTIFTALVLLYTCIQIFRGNHSWLSKCSCFAYLAFMTYIVWK